MKTTTLNGFFGGFVIAEEVFAERAKTNRVSSALRIVAH